jgi:8-oxo-dGTP pyrophosphatase MutT (NUDIX family)
MSEPIRRQSTRVAVVDGDRRVLLLHTCDPHRLGTEMWELPGGGLDPGEVPVDGARRELYEETGIDAEDLGPRLGVVEADFTFAGRRYRQRETIFLLRVERAECSPQALVDDIERAAHLGHDWISVESLQSCGLRLYPPQLPALLSRFVA